MKNIIHKLVHSKAEEQEAEAEGWHTHPALAIRARVMDYIEQTGDALDPKEKAKLLKSIPQVASADRIRQLEEEIQRLYKLHGMESKARELDLSPMRAAVQAATGEKSRSDAPQGDRLEVGTEVPIYNSDAGLAPVPKHLQDKLAAELEAARLRPAPTI